MKSEPGKHSQSRNWSSTCFFPNLSSRRCFVFEILEPLKDDDDINKRIGEINDYLSTVMELFGSNADSETDELIVHLAILYIGRNKKGKKDFSLTKVKKKNYEIFSDRMKNQITNHGNMILPPLEFYTKGTKDVFTREDLDGLRQKLFLIIFGESRSESSVPIKSLVSSLLELHSKLEFQFNSSRFITDCNDESFLLNREGILRFIDLYSLYNKGGVTYLPPINSIKSTKLYNTHYIDGGIWDPSASKHEGELEVFLKQFQYWIDKNSSGLMLYEFKSLNLRHIMIAGPVFRFEFDWLFFTQSRLFLFEARSNKDSKHLEKAIQEKLDQVFTNHIPSIHLIIWLFIEHIRKTDNFSELEGSYFENFFMERLSVVIFMAGVSTNVLKTSLVEVLKNPIGSEFNFDKISDLSLQSVYLAGEISKPSEEKIHFLRMRRDKNGQINIFEERNSPMKANEKDLDLTGSNKSLFQAIAGMFALGLMCKEGNKVTKWEESSSLDENFVDEQKKHVKERKRKVDSKQRDNVPSEKKQKLDDKLSEQMVKFAKGLKFILSPQQFTLLQSFEKKVILVGETGTGKTVLLLVKALKELRDENVDTVYFCIPESKQKTREFIMNMTRQESNIQVFHGDGRFHLITDERLAELHNKPLKELKRSMLLIDEYYCDYEESFKAPGNFLKMREKVFPHVAFCWVVDVVVRKVSQSFSKPDQAMSSEFQSYSKISDYFPLEMFTLKTLNVQFRCADHIAMFSSNLHHKGVNKGFTSALTSGTHVSSQTQCQLESFKVKSDIILKNLSQEFEEKDEKNRWAIVFCDEEQKTNWKVFLKFKNEFGQSVFGDIYLNSWSSNPSDCDFSGAETRSVVVVLDYPSDKAEIDENRIEQMLKIAFSRAQYELFILVHDSLKFNSEPAIEFFKKCLHGEFDTTQPVNSSVAKENPVDKLKLMIHQMIMEKKLEKSGKQLFDELEKHKIKFVQMFQNFFDGADNLETFRKLGRKFGRNMLSAIVDYQLRIIKNHSLPQEFIGLPGSAKNINTIRGYPFSNTCF